MNEYLSRGKRLDNGEWVEGCYVCAELLDGSGYEHFIIEISKNGETHKVDPSTIGRCTGLEDMNGKLIFESDIYHQGDKEIKYVVVWHDTGLIGKQIRSRSYAGLEYWLDGIEIIGNAHDNPELLEGGTNA